VSNPGDERHSGHRWNLGSKARIGKAVVLIGITKGKKGKGSQGLRALEGILTGTNRVFSEEEGLAHEPYVHIKRFDFNQIPLRDGQLGLIKIRCCRACSGVKP